MWVWIDGELSEGDQPGISVVDHGFTVGDGVFETIKVTHGEPIALTRHLQRLDHSATGLGLPTVDHDTVRDAVAQVLHQQPHELGVLRVTYTSGPGPLGSDRGSDGCTLAVVSRPGKPWPETAKVAVSPWPRNERSPLTGLKTTSYAENAVILAQAKRQGASEAILANLAGNLCEGTGSNVFVVIDGTVYTPPLSDGCLAGITRALVAEWFDIIERTLPISALADADEVFITSSTRDVHPVRAVDDRGVQAPGPLTEMIRAGYAERIAQDRDPA